LEIFAASSESVLNSETALTKLLSTDFCYDIYYLRDSALYAQIFVNLGSSIFIKKKILAASPTAIEK